MPTRLHRLHAWLGISLNHLHHRKDGESTPRGELTAIGSDASFRRYFRWRARAGESLIVMDAPPPQEDCRPFVRMAGRLRAAGLHVPEVLAADLEQGFLLLDDLGEQTYLEVLNQDNADVLFEDALQSLLRIQRAPSDGLPEYDAALLQRELQLFPDWYLGRHLGVSFTPAQQSAWQRVCRQLIASALAQNTVLVHRDYMPRNLMISTPNPGVLDFQDALSGPVGYDVTSLFKDAFISWPQVRVEAWLKRYWLLATRAGIGVPHSFDDFQRDCDLIGVQRHLKVIGIFSRICYRDGKEGYLEDLPRFFCYLKEVLARRPQLAELAALLADLPAVPEGQR